MSRCLLTALVVTGRMYTLDWNLFFLRSADDHADRSRSRSPRDGSQQWHASPKAEYPAADWAAIMMKAVGVDPYNLKCQLETPLAPVSNKTARLSVCMLCRLIKFGLCPAVLPRSLGQRVLAQALQALL